MFLCSYAQQRRQVADAAPDDLKKSVEAKKGQPVKSARCARTWRIAALFLTNRPRRQAGHDEAGHEAGHEANGHGLTPAQKTDRRTFASAEEARAGGPQEGCERWRVWSVSGPGGAPVYLWASNFSMSMVRGGQALGITAVCLDKPVNKEAVAAGLAAMSPEERAALLAQFMPERGR
jgi:hypothetical protein